MFMTNYLETMCSQFETTRQVNPKKVPVILNNRSLYSNGYVAWAPKRIEMVTTPPQDSYAQLWLDQLALHEYKHVIQLSTLNRGTTRLMNILFGEISTGAVAGYLPFWYLEGDAVAEETSLSSAGRGRLPSFSMKLKADLVNNKRYSYDKAYLGSFKTFIPNYYELGYQMVKHIRLNYGNSVLSNVNMFTGKQPYLLTPFNRGLKKYTGLSKKELYEEAMDTLQKKWKAEYEEKEFTTYREIYTDSNKYYASYRFPKFVGNDSIIALRSSMDDIRRFVLLNENQEKILYTPGEIQEIPFSYAGNKIMWVEYIQGSRWQKRSKSHIKIYHLKTDKLKVFRGKNRYLSAVFSEDGNHIAVIHVDLTNRYSLVILDAEEGHIQNTIPIPENIELSDLHWGGNNVIYGIANTNKGKYIVELNKATHEFNYLFHSSFINISYPVYTDNKLFFIGAFDGTDNIYMYNLSNQQLKKITSVPFGAYDPSIHSENNLLFTVYTSDGYRPAKVLLSQSQPVILNDIKKSIFEEEDILSKQEYINMQTIEISDSTYPVKPYYGVTDFLNVHSWTPFYLDYTIDEFSELPVYPGLTLFHQNKLSTFSGSISYYYKEGYHHFKPELTFAGLFPVISFSADYGGEPEFLSVSQNEEPYGRLFNYHTYSLSASVPLLFQLSKYRQYFLFDVEYNFSNSYYFDDGYKLGINNVRFYVYFSNWLKMSLRDIEPRWRQTLLLRYNNYLNDDFASQFSASVRFSIPGLFKHHVFTFGGSYEKQTLDIYQISNYISMPRGYAESDVSQFLFRELHPFTYEKINKFRMEYTMPLIEPDFSLGPFIYFKRFYISPFYDFVNASIIFEEDNSLYRYTQNFSSAGIEIFSDVHFLRFVLATFTPGFRASYTIENESVSYEFLFQLDF